VTNISAETSDDGRRRRTAVVFIHGQGEQRPMEAADALMDVVWRADPMVAQCVRSARVWSTPDPDSDTLDTRRMTTDSFKSSDRRVDFIEFYWAHKMKGNRFVDTLVWAGENWRRKSPARSLPTLWVLKLLPSFVLASLLLLVAAPFSDFLQSLSNELSEGKTLAVDSAFGDWVRTMGLWWDGILLRLGPVALIAPLLALILSYVASTRQSDRATRPGLPSPLLWLAPGFAVFWFAISACWLVVWRVHDFPANAGGDERWRAATGAFFLLGLAMSALFVFSWTAIAPFIRHVMGDSSRYLSPAPRNIECRAAIREAGVKLLQRLHDDGGYDRVIVLAHSLGTIIAYDILAQFWAGRVREWRADDALSLEIQAVERTGAALREAADALRTARRRLPTRATARRARKDALEILIQARADFWNAQRDLARTLRMREQPWLVTDLVTLGAPLTYAPYLLAKSEKEFVRRRDELLEFPSCPPVLMANEEGAAPSYRFERWRSEGPASGLRHDTLYAATRWTNLYFESWFAMFGDMIGGPVSNLFGPGVRDRQLQLIHAFDFAHLQYWTAVDGNMRAPHIAALRHALALFEDEPASYAEE